MKDTLILPAAEKPKSSKNLLISASVVLLALIGIATWRMQTTYTTSSYAYVEGLTLSVTAPASGTVKEILVEPGQESFRGMPLLSFDDSPLRKAVMEAAAGLEAARSGQAGNAFYAAQAEEIIKALLTQANQLRDAEQQAQKFLEHWTAEQAKAILVLRSPQAVAGPVRGEAIENEVQARAEVANYRAQLDTASRMRAETEAQVQRMRQINLVPIPLEQQLEVWEARLIKAERDLQQATVVAPDNGVIGTISVEPGTLVSAGQVMLSILPKPDVEGGYWITAFFTDDRVALPTSGQSCTIKLEQGPTLRGKMESVISEQNRHVATISINPEKISGIFPGQKATVSFKTR